MAKIRTAYLLKCVKFPYAIVCWLDQLNHILKIDCAALCDWHDQVILVCLEREAVRRRVEDDLAEMSGEAG